MNFIIDEQDLTKLIISSIIGAAIGFEREYKGKAAGFKTQMFICLGSTLFTIFSLKLGTDAIHDRIASNIVTGIGFLGAGAIFRDKENMVTGLTTATIIWVLAALGMGVGVGEYLFSITAAALVLLLLICVPFIEKLIDWGHEVRIFSISVRTVQKLDEVLDQMKEHQLTIRRIKRNKVEDKIILEALVSGKAKSIQQFTSKILLDTEVVGVDS